MFLFGRIVEPAPDAKPSMAGQSGFRDRHDAWVSFSGVAPSGIGFQPVIGRYHRLEAYATGASPATCLSVQRFPSLVAIGQLQL
jgi:hypothetical protein